MILKELHLTNFRSWKELSLTNLDEVGAVLILGDNGSGKSSIRQAIEYLLLDKTSDDLPLDELPFNGGKNCCIKGVFEKDNQNVVITKYRNSTEYGNSTFLEIDGDSSLTATDRRVTQKNISNFFGINNENTLYSSTIFSLNSPSFPALKEGERKPILYDILNLNKWNDSQNKVKEALNNINSSIKELDDSLVIYNSQIEEKENKLISLNSEINEYEISRKEKINELNDKINECVLIGTEESRLQISEIENNLQKLEDELVKKLELKDKYRNEIKLIGNEKLEIKLKLDSLKEEAQLKFRIQTEMESCNRELISLKEDEKQFEINKELEVIDYKEKIKNTNKELKETSHLENELKRIKKEKEELESAINKDGNEKNINNKNELISDLDLKEKNLKELNDSIKQIESEIEAIKKSSCPILGEHCDRLIEGSEIFINLNKKLEKLNKDKNVLEKNIKSLNSEFKILEKEIEKYNQLNVELDNLQNELSKVKAELKSELSLNQSIQNRIEEYEGNLKKLEGNENPYTPRIKEKMKYLLTLDTKLDDKKKDYKTDIKKLENDIVKLEEKNEELLAKIEEISSHERNRDKLVLDLKFLKVELKNVISNNESLKKRKIELAENIEKIKEEINPYTVIKRNTKDELIEVNKKIKNINKKIIWYNEEITYLEYWVKGFSKTGIPNLLCEDFLSSLEFETNKNLSQISDSLTIQISSQSDKKNKTVKEEIAYKVFDSKKKITNFNSYSSGQKQRVKTADVFAFHELVGFDFLILDEILELSLDEGGVEAIIPLLKNYKGRSLFVISHNDKIKDSFDKVWKIKINHNVSEMEILY